MLKHVSLGLMITFLAASEPWEEARAKVAGAATRS